jgi:hypothetical protein
MEMIARRNVWGLLLLIGGVVFVTECSGPESFTHQGPITGAGGANPGVAGTGAAGLGQIGTAGAGGEIAPGAAGAVGSAGASGAAGAVGSAGSGAAGAAAGASGAAGKAGSAGATGAAGAGAAGAGAAGAGAAGAGAAGATGAAGRAAGGTGGGAAGATPDAGTDTATADCNCALKVQYQCLQDGPNVGAAEYLVKVVNTGTKPIALDTVTVRYWYTVDTTGAQTGMCTGGANPCAISFHAYAPAKAKADAYAELTFAGGTLAPGASTADLSVIMHGTGNYNQANDYSLQSTGDHYVDDMNLTGYVAGKLLWGNAP